MEIDTPMQGEQILPLMVGAGNFDESQHCAEVAESEAPLNNANTLEITSNTLPSPGEYSQTQHKEDESSPTVSCDAEVSKKLQEAKDNMAAILLRFSETIKRQKFATLNKNDYLINVLAPTDVPLLKVSSHLEYNSDNVAQPKDLVIQLNEEISQIAAQCYQKLNASTYNAEANIQPIILKRNKYLESYAQDIELAYQEYANACAEQIQWIRGYYSKNKLQKLEEVASKIDYHFNRALINEEFGAVNNYKAVFKKVHWELATNFYKKTEKFKQMKHDKEAMLNSMTLELEKLSSVFKLNKEKLEYSIYILKSRHKRLATSLNDEQKLISRIQEAFTRTITNETSKQTKLKREKDSLASKYKALTIKFTQLIRAATVFQQTAQKKYLDTWKKESIEIDHLQQAVLNLELVIRENHLKINPGPQLFGNPGSFLPTENPPKIHANFSSANTKQSNALSVKEINIFIKPQQLNYPQSKVTQVLELVDAECSFVLTTLDHEKLKAVSEEEDRNKLRTKLILYRLGVHTKNDINFLVSQFFKGQDDDDDASLTVESDTIISLVNDFLYEKFLENETYYQNQQQAAFKKKNDSNEWNADLNEAEKEQKFIPQVNSKAKQFVSDLKNHFKIQSTVFPDAKLRTWKVLDHYLPKYLKLLKDTNALYEKVARLEKASWNKIHSVKTEN